MADLAAAAGLSPAHFSRRFKAAFGESPHQYLLTRRLERAAALLRATDWPVAGSASRSARRASARSPRASPGVRLAPLAYRAAYPSAERHLRIPRCVALAYAAGRKERTFREDGRPPFPSVLRGDLTRASGDYGGAMIKIANAQFWVHDQDEALAFYTKTLGWEVRADVTMEAWSFRWLCVGPPGQDGTGLVLMPIPGPPMLDGAGSAQMAELVAKGAGARCSWRPTTARPPTTTWRARGVTFNDPPTKQAYGIDTSFRDPSGNNIRLTQVLEFDPGRGSRR